MKKQPAPEPPPAGSFEHAEWVRAREMAKLTPAQRVKMVCEMNKIALRLGPFVGGWSENFFQFARVFWPLIK